MDSFVEETAFKINAAISSVIPDSWESTKAKLLHKVVLEQCIYQDSLATLLSKNVRSSAKKIFPAWKIMQQIDTGNNVGFNLGCVDSFRTIEEVGKGGSVEIYLL